MVLKSLNLARQSLAKTFTHGYAQSVVAASQSSYASQNHPFGTLHSGFTSRFAAKSQLLSAFQNSSSQAALSNKHGEQEQSDSGLAAYYAAWQKGQRLGEWRQFPFQKRIEWTAPTSVSDGKGKQNEVITSDGVAQEKGLKVTPAPERAYSSSAVDDFKRAVGSEEAEAAAIAKVDEAIAQEIARSKEEKLQIDDNTSEDASQAAAALVETAATNEVPESTTPISSGTAESLPLSENTKATTVSVENSYAEELNKLAEQHQYGDIPAVFEHMLSKGVKPTASAYNALLVSALSLTQGKHHIVPKALDVYSDMLRRRVSPDTTTYAILIELLSTRTLDVLASKEQLEARRVRYGGMEEEGKFMFHSNDAEFDILSEDDSLSLALKLFRSATTTYPNQPFAGSTYHSLVAACAEAGKVDDMVAVYSHMESQNVVPRADLFVPMIQAFGASGDLRSAVECYDEYKSLAIAHDNGELDMVRKDHEVYAALVKAYELCDRSEGGHRFLEKLETAAIDSSKVTELRDTVGLQAIIPHMLNRGAFESALKYSQEKLDPSVRDQALGSISTAAADANQVETATEAYSLLSDLADVTVPALAMEAMHIRLGDLPAAEEYWKILEQSNLRPEFLEAASMHAVALIGSGHADTGLRRGRQMFSRIRDSQSINKNARAEVIEQIDEAIEFIGHFVSRQGIMLPVKSSMELMWMMIDNGGLVIPVAGHLLAGLGPEAIAHLGWEDVNLLVQVQAGMIINGSQMDIAHEARFAHLFEVVLNSGMVVNKDTASLVEKALAKLGRSDLSQRWLQYRYPVAQPVYSPTPYVTPTSPTTSAFEDSYDPYATTTDNRGSVAITDLLEKTHGKSSSHLNEALTRFKNMRRAGRHPRFFTYAKLISAAAKEDRLPLAHDILALAKQDVPYLPQYRIVRFGWVSILDAMVAACLTTGQRRLAAQYHQDLLDMGAAPSANTFGLYITTLKESTKTFDEATEAVKIFIRAKSEGVEPSSFLYNALIGKLGKARRIDDCLFYFAEMRNLGIRPTSVTYGTIVNALCRVSDEKFAEELFEEMESMPNYKPRPAPYHSMMQFFLSTKRDRSKVLAYYDRMRAKKIQPTTHTYKLLIDTYATLDPVDMTAAEAVLDQIRKSGELPEAVHYASLVHAKGCVLHDIEGARKTFDAVLADRRIRPQACLYQALFEAMVANHLVQDTEPIVADMKARGVEMTPYIANSLIHGWAMAKNIEKAQSVYDAVPTSKREPSTYEAMTRAFMAVEDRENAMSVVNEGLSRGYPTAVANKILELVGCGRTSSVAEVAA